MNIQLDYWAPHELLLSTVAPDASITPHVVISGTCYNHPLKEDGAQVATGKITAVKIIVQDGEPCIMAVTASGVEYQLLQPALLYEKVFPNARQKIIDWWYSKHPEDNPIEVLPL